MGIIELIVMVMVITILATITLAAMSYAAFKVRERRAPSAGFGEHDETLYFERVRFHPAGPPDQ
jgi:Tfp pilus assembly protein PilE